MNFQVFQSVPYKSVNTLNRQDDTQGAKSKVAQRNKTTPPPRRPPPPKIHRGRVFDLSAFAGESERNIACQKKETQTYEGKEEGDEKRRKAQL